MKLFSWNVNGLRAVISKGEFQNFITKYDPDILCLQETKAQRSQVEINLPNYIELWNSAEKPGYSGTAIFSKTEPKSVIYNLLDEVANKYHLTDSYGNPDKEGRIISAEYDNFWVVTVYTPNSKNDLSRLALRHDRWDPAFLEHLKYLEKTKPVLVCGDMNVAHNEIDLANPKPNVGKHGFTNEERKGFNNFLEAGFIDTYRDKHPKEVGAYTWWTHWANSRARNVGWRIDYWLASKNMCSNIVDAEIHPEVMGSDHCPVSIEVK